MIINNGRQWSNRALKEIAVSLPRFENAINISGFLDSDKAGREYRSYFDVKTYEISKYTPDSLHSNPNSEILIDLDSDVSQLNKSWLGKYNLVFSHTVLEHVKNPFNAFKNFSALMAPGSLLINVVPFIYKFHFSKENYGDYWRYTPHGLEELHKSVDLRMTKIKIGPKNSFEKYIISVGSQNSDLFNDHEMNYETLNNNLGNVKYLSVIKNLSNKISNSIKARISI